MRVTRTRSWLLVIARVFIQKPKLIATVNTALICVQSIFKKHFRIRNCNCFTHVNACIARMSENTHTHGADARLWYRQSLVKTIFASQMNKTQQPARHRAAYKCLYKPNSAIMGHTSSHTINYCLLICNFVCWLIHRRNKMKWENEVANGEKWRIQFDNSNHLNEINQRFVIVFHFTFTILSITYMHMCGTYNVYTPRSEHRENSDQQKRVNISRRIWWNVNRRQNWMQLNSKHVLIDNATAGTFIILL